MRHYLTAFACLQERRSTPSVDARGGFLYTVLEGVTGVFFDRPEPAAIGRTVEELVAASWDADALAAHAERFSEERFVERLREIVAEEAGRTR